MFFSLSKYLFKVVEKLKYLINLVQLTGLSSKSSLLVIVGGSSEPENVTSYQEPTLIFLSMETRT